MHPNKALRIRFHAPPEESLTYVLCCASLLPQLFSHTASTHSSSLFSHILFFSHSPTELPQTPFLLFPFFRATPQAPSFALLRFVLFFLLKRIVKSVSQNVETEHTFRFNFFLSKRIVKSISQKAKMEYIIRFLFFILFSLQRILESVSEEAETEPGIRFSVFFAFSPKRMRYWV